MNPVSKTCRINLLKAQASEIQAKPVQGVEEALVFILLDSEISQVAAEDRK